MQLNSTQHSRSIGCYKFSTTNVIIESRTNSPMGSVVIGEHTLSRELVMLKILNKQQLQRQGKFRRLARQIALLKRIRHPTILQLLEMIQTNEEIYLVFEYVEGVFLSELLSAKKKFKQNTVVKIMYELVLCLEYLRKNRIVHGGINPESIYLHKGDHIKVMNFTNSKQIYKRINSSKPGFSSQKLFMYDLSRIYLDPFQMDTYDAGILMHTLLCGTSLQQQTTKVHIEKYCQMSKNARNFFSLLINCSKQHRLPDNFKSHPWFWRVDHKIANLSETEDVQCIKKLMKQLQMFGIDKKYALKCIMKNECNYVTTLYWLLKKKKDRETFSQQKSATSCGRNSKSPPILASFNRPSRQTNVQKQRFGRESQTTLKPSKEKTGPLNKLKKPRSSEKQKKKQKKFTIYEVTTDRRDSQSSQHVEFRGQSKKSQKSPDDYFSGTNLAIQHDKKSQPTLVPLTKQQQKGRRILDPSSKQKQ